MVDVANVTQEVEDAFKAIVEKQMRWCIVKFEGSNAVLEASGDRDSNIAAMAAATPDMPRLMYYDFETPKADGTTLKKLVFISYSPDTCTDMVAKTAMQNYRASVRAKTTVHKEMQVNDKRDLTEGEMRDLFGL